ncbi:hypothetical protein GPECTOR_10g1126 [Gonium pectorale]|uniref:Rubisco LSMT substrate-binding domain-containing protein n=1 Tax=Gonium pectorale TaxID=33097 RepID=A0A150GQP3_GONPE|nr:hypothetical protein GPECTOR_10g1126 [Gonium pectorale]|eukprot:KXZ52103.1 hypothetical protein GPECTOR_10g1126 [Gonium pectorale]
MGQAEDGLNPEVEEAVADAGALEGPVTLLSVPLRLCLSHEVPGCCPPALRSPALRDLFASGERWEVKLAAALVWTCRLHRRRHPGPCRGSAEAAAREQDEAAAAPEAVAEEAGDEEEALQEARDAEEAVFASFWWRYQQLLPPAETLTTLLFFQAWELRELQARGRGGDGSGSGREQDPPLAAAARSWQAGVLTAYDRWMDTTAFRREAGRVGLSEWLRAVGAVESRAFGFRADDGSELHAYVPFFCCANYAPGAPTLHVLRPAPPEEAAHEASALGSGGCSPQPPGTEGTAAVAAPRTPLASSLVEQYGFVLYGNPYDRLDWGGLQLDPGARVRRDWVHSAAEQLAAEAEEAEAQAAGATEEGDTGWGRAAGHGDAGAAAKVPGRQGSAAAERARLRCAAASVVAVAGWR